MPKEGNNKNLSCEFPNEANDRGKFARLFKTDIVLKEEEEEEVDGGKEGAEKKG